MTAALVRAQDGKTLVNRSINEYAEVKFKREVTKRLRALELQIQELQESLKEIRN
jgi:hypothetical protein